MTDPVKLYTKNVAKNADNVLEQARGVYAEVLVIGLTPDNVFDVRATLGLSPADFLWLTETFKLKLLSGDYAAENFND